MIPTAYLKFARDKESGQRVLMQWYVRVGWYEPENMGCNPDNGFFAPHSEWRKVPMDEEPAEG